MPNPHGEQICTQHAAQQQNGGSAEHEPPPQQHTGSPAQHLQGAAHLHWAEDAAQRAAVDLHGRPLLAPQVLLHHKSKGEASRGEPGSTLQRDWGCAALRAAEATHASHAQIVNGVPMHLRGERPPVPPTLISFSTVESLACCAAAAPLPPLSCWPSSIRLMACRGEGRQGGGSWATNDD